jgi:hypothetical protein
MSELTHSDLLGSASSDDQGDDPRAKAQFMSDQLYGKYEGTKSSSREHEDSSMLAKRSLDEKAVSPFMCGLFCFSNWEEWRTFQKLDQCKCLKIKLRLNTTSPMEKLILAR